MEVSNHVPDWVDAQRAIHVRAVMLKHGMILSERDPEPVVEVQKPKEKLDVSDIQVKPKKHENTTKPISNPNNYSLFL